MSKKLVWYRMLASMVIVGGGTGIGLSVALTTGLTTIGIMIMLGIFYAGSLVAVRAGL